MPNLTSATANAGSDALTVTWVLDSDVPAGTVLLTAGFGDNLVGITFQDGNRVGHYVTVNGTQLALPRAEWSVAGGTVTAQYPNDKLNGIDPSAKGEAKVEAGGESSAQPLA